jgi:hypothetical protein
VVWPACASRSSTAACASRPSTARPGRVRPSSPSRCCAGQAMRVGRRACSNADGASAC